MPCRVVGLLNSAPGAARFLNNLRLKRPHRTNKPLRACARGRDLPYPVSVRHRPRPAAGQVLARSMREEAYGDFGEYPMRHLPFDLSQELAFAGQELRNLDEERGRI